MLAVLFGLMGAAEPPFDETAVGHDGGAEPTDDKRAKRRSVSDTLTRWGESGVLKLLSTVTALLASLVAVPIAVVSLHKANTLQREDNRLQQASLNSRLEEAMVGVDEHFVTYARLRPYFFRIANGETMPPATGRLSFETKATAELIVDFADDVASYLRTDMMQTKDVERWTKILRPYYEQSPIMRLMWKEEEYKVYDNPTACVLGAPPPKITSSWYRKTINHQYVWRKPCNKIS